MKYKINSYLAILIITVTGVEAAKIIIHVATQDTFPVLMISPNQLTELRK